MQNSSANFAVSCTVRPSSSNLTSPATLPWTESPSSSSAPSLSPDLLAERDDEGDSWSRRSVAAGEGLAVGGRRGVVAVGPKVVQDHGQEGDEEEGGIDVRHEVGFIVGRVCEDGLSESQFCLYLNDRHKGK